MANFIPRVSVSSEPTKNEPRRFEAQLCAAAIVSLEEIEAIKLAPASVPTVYRQAVEGDCIVLAIDGSGSYGTPRLRIDNKFKNNGVFENTPKFTLADILEQACNDAGEIDPESAMAFAKSLQKKYLNSKKEGRKSILNALLKK